MGKNTSVSPETHFEDLIEGQINMNIFINTSEVMHAGLRLEEEGNLILLLRNAIEEGLDSGIAKDLDPHKHLESLKAGRK